MLEAMALHFGVEALGNLGPEQADAFHLAFYGAPGTQESLTTALTVARLGLEGMVIYKSVKSLKGLLEGKQLDAKMVFNLVMMGLSIAKVFEVAIKISETEEEVREYLRNRD